MNNIRFLLCALCCTFISCNNDKRYVPVAEPEPTFPVDLSRVDMLEYDDVGVSVIRDKKRNITCYVAKQRMRWEDPSIFCIKDDSK